MDRDDDDDYKCVSRRLNKHVVVERRNLFNFVVIAYG